jgi:flavin reductase (DIM6/NTAB) family NADH-FMN oxidoreductase RutF
MPLSFNPTLVGVAIDPEHETYKLILESEVFAINWLDCSCASRIAELREISGREYPNKLSAVGLTAVNGKRTSQPLIQEALAVLECKIHERFRTGTHELIVGEVIEASASDFFTDYWDFSKYDPPLYAGTADGGIKSWVFMSTRGVTVRVPLKHMT